MTRLAFYLDQFESHKAQGLAAHRAGRAQEARTHLLEAARALYQMAARSDGPLKAERIANAEKLVAMAKAVREQQAQPRGEKAAPRASKGAPQAAEDGKDDAEPRFQAVDRPAVRFEDIAGLEKVKDEIRLHMILPFRQKERAEKFGIRRGGGLLLYGPPGTGKTLVARAIAGELEAAFYTVKPSDILSKWVGDAEKNIAALFQEARAQALSVIFIDEIEALIPARSGQQSTVMQRLVPQILAELEGFAGKGQNPLLFIGATNEPWSLDPAVMRPGRFDAIVYVGLPDDPARRRIFELQLAGRALAKDVALDDLAARTEGYSGADLRAVCQEAATKAFREAVESDCDMPIDGHDFAAALEQVRPSVLPRQHERFEKFRKEREA